MEQPGKAANLAYGQLNRENDVFLSPFAPGSLVSRDKFGRPICTHVCVYVCMYVPYILLLVI